MDLHLLLLLVVPTGQAERVVSEQAGFTKTFDRREKIESGAEATIGRSVGGEEGCRLRLCRLFEKPSSSPYKRKKKIDQN